MRRSSAQRPIPQAQLRALVDTYLDAWNETDSAVRLRHLHACWDEDGRYEDPTVQVRGLVALARHIHHVQVERPGVRLEVVGDVDHHHSVARFDWRLVRADGSTGRVSTDFAEVGFNGLLVRVSGFFGA